MNDEAVYRTAPATPGLLNIIYIHTYMTLHTNSFTTLLSKLVRPRAQRVLDTQRKKKIQETIICIQTDKQWLLNFPVLPGPVSNGL